MIKNLFWVTVLFLLPLHSLYGLTIAPSNISTNTNWTKSESPYFVSSPLTVVDGINLNLEPGVIVKFNIGAYMIVNGRVDVQGSTEDKIYFTSINDDIGGDTNDNGSATAPAPRDWMQIALSSTGIFNATSTEIRFGGRAFNIFTSISPALVNSGGILNLNNINLHSNHDGVYVNGGTTTISNSKIIDNANRGIVVESDPGSFNISSSSISNNGIGVKISSSVSLSRINATDNWWGDASGPLHATLNQTGLGNRIESNYVDFIPWLTLDPFATTTTGITKPVIIIPGILGSADHNGTWVIDPLMHVYDDLIDTLKANGYLEGETLFTFPYDWRNSNVGTAIILKDKITEVKNICGCGKVDLVTQSMGGLVARQYIQSINYGNDVDHLIFLGTPHLGSPKSYLMWEGGELDPDKDSFLLKFFLKRMGQKEGFNNLFDYVRNRPINSVKELLPIYSYIKDKDTNTIRNYPLGYPTNNFLENLSANVSSLLNSGIKISNFVGNNGSETIGTIRVVPSTLLPLWQDGYPDGFDDNSSSDKGLERTQGDDTVPFTSTDSLQITDIVSRSAEHIKIPEQFSDLVFNRLTSQNATVIVDNPEFPNFKLIIIKILSPADIVVIAPDGKKVGKDFNTMEEINEIEGAFYSGFLTDNEFISIPNPLDGEYKVQVQGTGNGGKYTLATGYFDEEKSSEKDIEGVIESSNIQEINININSNEENPLEAEPEDTVPPSIVIHSPNHKDYLRSEMLFVNIDISDSDSGVASSTIFFDNNPTNNGTSIDLFFKNLGEHSVSVSAYDMFFNMSSSTVNFKIVANIDSTISDINRAYDLGWIKDKKAKDALIKKLQSAKKAKKPDKKLIKALLLDLKFYKKDKINEKAYNLIKEDLEWIINN